MKLVKEVINFERGKDPRESMNIGLMKALEDKGIRFWFGWGNGKGEIEKQNFLKNINKMNAFIDKMISVGVDPKKMFISHADHVRINVVQIINGNRVLHECISKEDAEILMKVCIALSIENENQYRIDTTDNEKIVYEYTHPWLNNIIENRKKYKDI